MRRLPTIAMCLLFSAFVIAAGRGQQRTEVSNPVPLRAAGTVHLDGRPLGGAIVSLRGPVETTSDLRHGDPPLVVQSTTRADGRFELHSDEKFDCVLEVEGPGVPLGWRVRPPTRYVRQTAGTDVGLIAIESGVAVSGRVVDAEGAPLAGARVFYSVGHGTWYVFRRFEPIPSAELFVTTDDDGRYVIENVAPGARVFVRAETDDHVGEETQGLVRAETELDDLRLEAGFTLTGQVVCDDQPVGGAWVRAGSGQRSTVHTDEEGRFEIRCVGPGWISVRSPGIRSPELRARPGGLGRIEVERAASITVHVEGQGGQKVTVAHGWQPTIHFRAPQDPVREDAGAFVFRDAVPGIWTLRAWAPGFGASEAVTFELGVSEAREVTLRIEPFPVVEVAVMDVRGEPIAGATVSEGLSWPDLSPAPREWSKQVLTDERGTARLRVPELRPRARLGVSAKGYLGRGAGLEELPRNARGQLEVRLTALAELVVRVSHVERLAGTPWTLWVYDDEARRRVELELDHRTGVARGLVRPATYSVMVGMDRPSRSFFVRPDNRTKRTVTVTSGQCAEVTLEAFPPRRLVIRAFDGSGPVACQVRIGLRPCEGSPKFERSFLDEWIWTDANGELSVPFFGEAAWEVFARRQEGQLATEPVPVRAESGEPIVQMTLHLPTAAVRGRLDSWMLSDAERELMRAGRGGVRVIPFKPDEVGHDAFDSLGWSEAWPGIDSLGYPPGERAELLPFVAPEADGSFELLGVPEGDWLLRIVICRRRLVHDVWITVDGDSRIDLGTLRPDPRFRVDLRCALQDGSPLHEHATVTARRVDARVPDGVFAGLSEVNGGLARFDLPPGDYEMEVSSLKDRDPAENRRRVTVGANGVVKPGAVGF